MWLPETAVDMETLANLAQEGGRYTVLAPWQADVPAGSVLAGRTVGELHHGSALRILALDGRWLPREDLTVEAGAAIAVVGTRAACDDLLRAEPAAAAVVAVLDDDGGHDLSRAGAGEP